MLFVSTLYDFTDFSLSTCFLGSEEPRGSAVWLSITWSPLLVPSPCSLTPDPQCGQPASQTPCGNVHNLWRGQSFITSYTSFLSFFNQLASWFFLGMCHYINKAWPWSIMQSMCLLKQGRSKSEHECIYKPVKLLFPFLCMDRGSFVSHVFLPKAGIQLGMFVVFFFGGGGGGGAESNVHGFRF